jgi:hypothetical protein
LKKLHFFLSATFSFRISMLQEIEKIREFHFVKKCKLGNEGCRKSHCYSRFMPRERLQIVFHLEPAYLPVEVTCLCVPARRQVGAGLGLFAALTALANSSAAPSSRCRFQAEIMVGCTPKRLASWAAVSWF